MWRSYWRTAMGTAAGAVAVLWLAIALVDPYGSVFFAPDLLRAPVATNQRFSFPMLARDPRFDSAVAGTSTMRLMRPVVLNRLFDASFANLSMNSGTAYEQSEILRLFAQARERPKVLILGLDVVWCERGETLTKFTPRPFPPWLYDEDPLNDLLHLFHPKAVEHAGQQLGFLLGLTPPRRGLDGYTRFVPPKSEYDLDLVRNRIYRQSEPKPIEPVEPPVDIPAEVRAEWRYPALPLLDETLGRFPTATRKVLIFTPYHVYGQPRRGSEQAALWDECKRRVATLARAHANTVVLDFMIPSEITRYDTNYWDVLHYTTEVADRLAALIHEGAQTETSRPGLFRVLADGRAAPGRGVASHEALP